MFVQNFKERRNKSHINKGMSVEGTQVQRPEKSERGSGVWGDQNGGQKVEQ